MYNIFAITDSQNPNLSGYVLTKDKEVLEELVYDKEKTSYKDIIQKKIDFISGISEKYPEINWKRMLITLVAKDNDFVEFYKQVFYKNDNFEIQDRSETFDEKITPDEKLYLDVCLKEIRTKLEP